MCTAASMVCSLDLMSLNFLEPWELGVGCWIRLTEDTSSEGRRNSINDRNIYLIKTERFTAFNDEKDSQKKTTNLCKHLKHHLIAVEIM